MQYYSPLNPELVYCLGLIRLKSFSDFFDKTTHLDMEKPLVSSIDQYIIDKVQKLRLSHNLTMKEFGYILNVSPSFIWNVENPQNIAKYNIKHLNILAFYFELSPKYFLPNKAVVPL